MPSAEKQFVAELEVYRIEIESGIKFLYTWLTLHAVATKNEKVSILFNSSPIFWNTIYGALQSSFIITIGRVFDSGQSTHSIDKLLNLAHQNLDIFSKESLATRKSLNSINSKDWIDDYLKNVYVPKKADLRKIKHYVSLRRKIYDEKYSSLRNKIIAHKEKLSDEQIRDLYSKADIKELQKLYTSICKIYEVLWQLLHNGLKPNLKNQRYSVTKILKNSSPEFNQKTLQERTIRETEKLLCLLAANVTN